MTQESLFPELQPLPVPEDPAPPALPITEEPYQVPHSQLLLFTPLTIHRTALERAAAEGDFAEAVRLRETLSSEHGPAAVPGDLSCLDLLVACTRDLSDLPSVLAAWRSASDTIATPGRRKQMTRGFYSHLVARVDPGKIARTDDGCLSDLANFLNETGRTHTARSLIRDALLRDVDVAPDSIEEPMVRDLLAETLAPRWLACLGALRGVWPAPRPEEPELHAITAAMAQPVPGSDEDKALAFWECLRVVALKGHLPESSLHATRRRMKELHPEFHQIHLNRGL